VRGEIERGRGGRTRGELARLLKVRDALLEQRRHDEVVARDLAASTPELLVSLCAARAHEHDKAVTRPTHEKTLLTTSAPSSSMADSFSRDHFLPLLACSAVTAA